MSDPAGPDPLAAALATALATALGQPVAGLQRLSGGASQETWAFELGTTTPPRGLILRRAPAGAAQRSSGSAGLAAEAALITLAGQHSVPVPEVLRVLQPADGLGDGFIMQRLPGETLGRRIAAAHRPALAWQCGQALARIHALPLAGLPALRRTQPRAEVGFLRDWHARMGAARPVFQLALRWLADHAPADVPAALVHGDFRNGNLMVDLQAGGQADPQASVEADPQVGGGALVGVLDWELAHLGDPMADLGWIAVNAWRFGQPGRPVGGFGQWDALFGGYRAAGGVVDHDRVRWWQVLGTLRWGVICESMGQAWLSGAEGVMEKAAIARRASETEIDLLDLLLPRPHPLTQAA